MHYYIYIYIYGRVSSCSPSHLRKVRCERERAGEVVVEEEEEVVVVVVGRERDGDRSTA